MLMTEYSTTRSGFLTLVFMMERNNQSGDWQRQARRYSTVCFNAMRFLSGTAGAFVIDRNYARRKSELSLQ